jgi:hypothetical protein
MNSSDFTAARLLPGWRWQPEFSSNAGAAEAQTTPHATTAVITSIHGAAVYDTLFG